MREKDITPKVIELAKAIAEHWRMEIYVGCRYVQEAHCHSEIFLHYGVGSTTKEEVEQTLNKGRLRDFFIITPIPDIRDCLEKLRALGIPIQIKDRRDRYADDRGWTHQLAYGKPKKTSPYKAWGGIINGTLYEALLSALLEVLK